MADHYLFGGKLQVSTDKFTPIAALRGALEIILTFTIFVTLFFGLRVILPASGFDFEMRGSGWLLSAAVTIPALVACLFARLYLRHLTRNIIPAPNQFVARVIEHAAGWPLAFAVAVVMISICFPFLVLSGSVWTAAAVIISFGLALGLSAAIVGHFNPVEDETKGPRIINHPWSDN